LICAGGYGQSYFHGLLANVHYGPINYFSMRMLDNVRVLPALIVTSSVETNSVNMASTWSRPASTLIMSELGFAYFFVRIEARNAVKVYIVSLSYMKSAMEYLHQGHVRLQGHFRL